MNSSTDDINQMMAAARNGSPSELATLAETWQRCPESLHRDLLSIFLDHLNSSDVPTDISLDTLSDIAARYQPPDSSPYFRAFWCLSALVTINRKILDLYAEDIIRAWPGIFGWGTFFYVSRVQTRPLGSKKNKDVERSTYFVRAATRDIISGAWFALTHSEAIRQVMTDTRGLAKVAVGLWDHDGDYQLDPAEFEEARRTSGTITLDSKQSVSQRLTRALTGDQHFVQKILSVIEDTEGLVKIVVSRLKSMVKAPEIMAHRWNDLLEIIRAFALVVPQHPILEAMMDRGACRLCTRLLVKIALTIQTLYPRRTKDLEELLVSGFWCLVVLVTKTTSGLPWVIQTIKAGILTAFVESSLVFHRLTDTHYAIVAQIFREIIPTYLCYRPVIKALDIELQSLERTKQFLALPKTRAWSVFSDVTKLTAIRQALITHKINQMVLKTRCGNTLCNTADKINNFRKCTSCHLSLYCSRECQKAHWKRGHKARCYEYSKNRLDISIRDQRFLEHLSVHDARASSLILKAAAAEQLPGVPLRDLVICSDYRIFPLEFRLYTKDEWLGKSPGSLGGEDLVRADVKVKTVIVIMGPFGEKTRTLVHRSQHDIWKTCAGDQQDGSFTLDATGSNIIDLVHEIGMANWRNYWGLGDADN